MSPCCSKKTAVNLVDQVNVDHDAGVLKMKQDVERIHREETTQRALRAKASAGVSGFSLYGDNVGKIVQPR